MCFGISVTGSFPATDLLVLIYFIIEALSATDYRASSKGDRQVIFNRVNMIGRVYVEIDKIIS